MYTVFICCLKLMTTKDICFKIAPFCKNSTEILIACVVALRKQYADDTDIIESNQLMTLTLKKSNQWMKLTLEKTLI